MTVNEIPDDSARSARCKVKNPRNGKTQGREELPVHQTGFASAVAVTCCYPTGWIRHGCQRVVNALFSILMRNRFLPTRATNSNSGK